MIKPSYEVIQPANGQSFSLKEFDKIAFDAPYHFHPEYELTYIVKGRGKRYAGNNMDNFESGDLVLLGPDLPHCWKIEMAEEQDDAQAIVIQFSADFLGSDFFDRAEMLYIKQLFNLSASGVCYVGKMRTEVGSKLRALLLENNSFKTLISFLEILQLLAGSKEYKLLDQQRTGTDHQTVKQERINPVFAYMVDNFRTQVSLEKAADIANMTPNAFCKYFKKITRKTFMETVIEYRLNYATQQLVQTDKAISEISFDSGFGDVSHFYKTFKYKMHLSPLNYRKRFMHNLQGKSQLKA